MIRGVGEADEENRGKNRFFSLDLTISDPRNLNPVLDQFVANFFICMFLVAECHLRGRRFDPAGRCVLLTRGL